MNRTLHRWLSVAGLLWPAFTSSPIRADAPPSPDVKVIHPTRGEIVRYVTLPGTIRANQQVTLYAKVAGYLKSLAVDKGDAVEAGQSLGEIEVPELIADLARYKAELVRAEAEVKVADLEAGRLAKALRQAPDLVVPQTLDNSEGRLAMARAGVEMARANLERTDTLLRFARITAPFAGIVTARFVDPGAFIPAATSGSAAQSAAIITLADSKTVRAQVALPEAEAALARVGQPVSLSVEGLVGKTFTAKISRLSHALDEATRTMLIEADVPNADLALRPGMYATVKVGVDRHANALLVPVETLVVEKARTSVFTLAEGKARKVQVKSGFEDGKSAEILDGLTAKDTVILPGRLALADGQPVRATEAQ
jgi:RND family efflux transporter MFP subunit